MNLRDIGKKLEEAFNGAKQSINNSVNDNRGWIRQGQFTPGQQLQRIGSDVGYQARDFANQTAQKAWSPTGILGGSVNAIQSGINTVSNLPRIELLKQQREQIQNPVLRTGANLAIGLPESLINIPRNYLVGISRVGQELGTARKENRPLNFQNLAGGVAPLTESLVDVGTAGFGKPVVGAFKEGAKLGIKQAVKKEALKGAGLGALGGLTYGVDTQYGKEFNTGDVAQNILGGALLGGVVGGVSGGAGAVKNKLFGGYKKLGLPDKVADELANKHFIRSENRPVVVREPKAQREFNAKINTVLKRPLNTPVFTDDLKKYTNIVEGLPDIEIGIGMTTKNVSKNPLEISTKGVGGEGIKKVGLRQGIEMQPNPPANPMEAVYWWQNKLNEAEDLVTQVDNPASRRIRDTMERGYKEAMAKFNSLSPEEVNKYNAGFGRSISPSKGVGGGGNGFIDQSGRLIPVDQHSEAAFKQFKTAGSKNEALTELMTRGNIRTVIKPTEANFEVIGQPTPSQLNRMVEQSQGKKIYFDLTDTKGDLVESKAFDNQNEFLSYLQSKFSPPKGVEQPKIINPVASSEVTVPKIKIKDEPYIDKNGQLRFPGTPKTKGTSETFKGAADAADFAQLKAQEDPESFRKVFAEWIGKRDSARTKATVIASDFTKVPGDPIDVIKAIENPSAKVSPEQATYIKNIRKTYDQLFAEAKNSGVDLNYIRDYITHIWDRPQGEVQQIYKAAKQKFNFANDRTVPTYEEGIKLGLTPKYNNPAQILENYVRRLQETTANLELFNKLKSEKLIVHGSTVRGNPGFAPINAPGFPSSRVKLGPNETYVGNWYAPTEVASQINKVMTPQDSIKVVSGLRNASGVIQDVTMSGGIPATPANAWTFAQMTKEMLSGRIVSPIKSFVRSLSQGSSNQFFKENAGQIVKMQENNIPVRTSFRVENMIDSSAVKKTFGERVASVWNKAVNDPTFQRFAPQLEISLFNDIEKEALANGKTAEEATKIAARAVKNFYGVTGSDTTALKNKITEDLKGAVFFAPKYRESMINFWINNVKALANPTSLENKNNVRFIIGATMTYIVMNGINKVNTGKNMWENPSGKEDKMLIKTKDGYIGIPFLSSIATVPRTIYSMGRKAVSGDLTGAALQGKGLLSSAVRPPLDVITNQDYFGGDITDPNNPSWTDRGKYLAGQYNHPYIRELMNVGLQSLSKNTKKKLGLNTSPVPAYQTISKAMELPFRFYNNKNGQDALQTGYYFDDRNQIIKTLDKESMTAWDILHPPSAAGREVDNRTISTQQKAVIMLNNPKVQQAEEALALAQKQRGEKVDPIWDLTPTQRRIVWASQVQLPGQKNTYDTYLSGQSWYKPYLNARNAYYDSLPKSEPTITSPGTMAYPEPDAYTQRQMDAKNWKDPSVQAWFKARDEYNNQQLLALGLPPMDTSGGYSSKPKKITIKMAKYSTPSPTIKIASARPSSIKFKKAPSVKFSTTASKNRRFTIKA